MDAPRWPVPAVALALAVAALVAGGGPAVGGGPGVDPAAAGPCIGTVTAAASGATVVSVQGAKGGQKRPARLLGLGPGGGLRWAHDSGANGVVWSYDVDPLPNGNLFVTTTVPGDTVVYEFDPRTGERVWQEHFDAKDTHDADLIDGGRAIVVANMRNYDPESGENHDRVFVYNRTLGEVTWEWEFEERYDAGSGGNYSEDWTHVNDVDPVGDDLLLLSPRNLDQVLLLNRTTEEVELVLGEDDDHSILHEQHNPDYLEGPDGRPTLLVADSENDRVVEYARTDGGEWERTWTLSGGFSWPRDADRLPNGNTLVVDSWHHRVVEVTPDGEVVWEVYTPWLPYDAERVRTGDGSAGPTIAEQGASGDYTVSGGARLYRNDSALSACASYIAGTERTTATAFPTDGGPGTVTGSYGTPGEPDRGGVDWVLLAAVGVIVAAVGGGLALYGRDRGVPDDSGDSGGDDAADDGAEDGSAE